MDKLRNKGNEYDGIFHFLESHPFENKAESLNNINPLPLPEIKSALTVYPSIEDFKNPFQYLNSLSSDPEITKYGLVKIVPPFKKYLNNTININYKSKERCSHYSFENLSIKNSYHTFQKINGLSKGKSYIDSVQKTSLKSFIHFSNIFSKNFQHTHDISMIEKLFWYLISSLSPSILVSYLCEISIDNINKPRRSNGWKLPEISKMSGSILEAVNETVIGANSPFLNIGMLFSSFCWHCEEDLLQSLNFLNDGSPKQWYGIPSFSSYFSQFEEITRNYLSLTPELSPELMLNMDIMTPLDHIINNNLIYIPVYRMIQYPGEYVLTFSGCYHSGFNYGLNISETINLAFDQWVTYGHFSSLYRLKINVSPLFSFSQILLNIILYHHKSHDMYKFVSILMKCFKKEYKERQKLNHDIFRQLTSLFHLPSTIIQSTDIPNCEICKQFLFFSYLYCSCHQKYFCIDCLYSHPSIHPVSSLSYFFLPFSTLRQLLNQIPLDSLLISNINNHLSTDFVSVSSISPSSLPIDKDIDINKDIDIDINKEKHLNIDINKDKDMDNNKEKHKDIDFEYEIDINNDNKNKNGSIQTQDNVVNLPINRPILLTIESETLHTIPPLSTSSGLSVPLSDREIERDQELSTEINQNSNNDIQNNMIDNNNQSSSISLKRNIENIESSSPEIPFKISTSRDTSISSLHSFNREIDKYPEIEMELSPITSDISSISSSQKEIIIIQDPQNIDSLVSIIEEANNSTLLSSQEPEKIQSINSHNNQIIKESKDIEIDNQNIPPTAAFYQHDPSMNHDEIFEIDINKKNEEKSHDNIEIPPIDYVQKELQLNKIIHKDSIFENNNQMFQPSDIQFLLSPFYHHHENNSHNLLPLPPLTFRYGEYIQSHLTKLI